VLPTRIVADIIAQTFDRLVVRTKFSSFRALVVSLDLGTSSFKAGAREHLDLMLVGERPSLLVRRRWQGGIDRNDEEATSWEVYANEQHHHDGIVRVLDAFGDRIVGLSQGTDGWYRTVDTPFSASG
jgi:hypothetical protein